jgi:membrane fusion protein, multidrug efflux system
MNGHDAKSETGEQVRRSPRRNGSNPPSEPPAPSPTQAPPSGPDAKQEKPARRLPARARPLLIGLAVIGALAGLLYYLHSRHFEDTDDAQIDADISNVGARVSGTVTEVAIVENQPVKTGDVLVKIDPTDLEVAVAQAKAAVAQAEAQVAAEDPTVLITEASNAAELTNASSNIASASAAISAANKDVDQATARLAEAQANAANAELERKRGRQLFENGALPRADLDHRESAATAAAAVVDAARQSLAGARERVSQLQAQLAGIRGRLTEVRKNAPRQLETRRASVLFRQANLELARAQERQARLNLGYATVRAPVAGIVARKAVNVGDHVAPGQQLVAIAQTDRIWVTANFRESQIRRVRPGQTVSVHVDALDRGFSGTVESLGGATGSRLSVFPPENASGNYVKVVQRLPVRIRLDPGQPGAEQLRPGMSVEPKVRVSP